MTKVLRKSRPVFERREVQRRQDDIRLDGGLRSQTQKRETHRELRPRPTAFRHLVQPARGKASRIASARSGGMPWRFHFKTACRVTPIALATAACPTESSNAVASELNLSMSVVNHNCYPSSTGDEAGGGPINHRGGNVIDITGMSEQIKATHDTTVHDPRTYGGRLGIAIEQARVTVRDLAKHLDVSPQSVYKVMRGDSKTLQVGNHLKAAKFLGVEPGWLSDARGPMIPPREITLDGNSDYPAIKHVAIRFSAGVTGYEVQQVDEQESQPIVFRASWFRARSLQPGQLVAATVMGPSMESTLYDGDLVIINLADTNPREGEVYALRHDDELVLKRLFREAGGWVMRSDNPDQRRHPQREMGSTSAVIGRVVYRQSERL